MSKLYKQITILNSFKKNIPNLSYIKPKNNNTFYNNIVRNYSTNNNDNENIVGTPIKPQRKISKELESLGAYLPKEEYTGEEYTDEYEYEEGEEQEEVVDFSNDKSTTLPKNQQYNNNIEVNNEEISAYGKKFQDMIYRIKENHELSAKHSVDLLNDMDEFDSFEELEKKIDEKLKKKYQEKVNLLDSMQETDFIEKDYEKVQQYNKISDNFISVNTHFETPFEKTEKQLENKEIQRPSGLSSMISETSNNSINAFNKVNQNDDISSRISKIKQRIQKDKLTNHRINGEDLNNLFSLYREDPIKNSPSVLAKKFNLSQKSLENLFKYTTIPIIVKFNTGIKSGHWNVIYER